MKIEDMLRAEIAALRQYIEALEDAITSGHDAGAVIRMRKFKVNYPPKVDVPSGVGE